MIGGKGLLFRRRGRKPRPARTPFDCSGYQFAETDMLRAARGAIGIGGGGGNAGAARYTQVGSFAAGGGGAGSGHVAHYRT